MTKRKVRSFLSLFLVFGILFQISPAVHAQSPASSQYEILGSIGGPTNAVAVNGTYVYVGKGTSVIVLENAGGRLLQKGNQLKLPAFITDLKVEDGILYAADGAEGLYMIDIRNPLEPTQIGVYKPAGYAEAVEVKDTTVYLADGTEGLLVIDASNPSNPQALGQVYKGKYAFGVAVSGNNAYIAASNDGVLIAEISQNSAPKELGSYNTPGVARNVAVSGNLAYVADDWKGISIVDISNPAKPVSVKTINTAGRAHDVALDKNYLYVADAYMGLRIFDIADISAPKDLTSFVPISSQLIRVIIASSMVYCADQTNGILCFDKSNPAALKMTGFYSHTIPIPLLIPDDIAQYGYKDSIARLLVLGIITGKPDGMKPWDNLSRAELATILCNTMNVQKAVNESTQRFKDVPKTHWAFSYIEKAAQIGLMSGKGDGLFDPNGVVTNAEAVAVVLRLVGRAPASGTWPSNIMDASGKFGLGTYIEGQAGDVIRRGNIFALIDKTVMEIPDATTRQTLLQSKFGIELQGFPMNCIQTAVKDGYAYVTCGTSGLSVVDASNPANCVQVAHLDFPELVGHIRIYKNYVYLPAKNHLFVVDISDPLHPLCVDAQAMRPSNGPARGVDIESETMYIADEMGFKIISLSDPAKPVLVKHQMLMGDIIYGVTNQSSDIAVRGGIVYVSMGSAGTMLFDVTDANAPVYLGAYKGTDYSDYAMNIHLCGNLGISVSGGVTDILDISDIKKPKSVDQLNTIHASQFYNNIGEYKNLMLLPNDDNGIAVLDVSNPSDIRQTGTIDTVGIAANVCVEDNDAYVADSLGGMCVIGLDGVPSAAQDRNDGFISSGSVSSFNTKIFVGFPAEKYVLSSEKALAVLNNLKTSFTETLTVKNTNDSGPGSLRWCLENVKNGGRILFDTNVFSPTKPGIIYLKSTLQFSTGNITLDASNAGVIIDKNTTEDVNQGFSVNTDGNVIRGLTLRNFTEAAIYISGGNNIVGGNRLNGAGPNGQGNVVLKGGGGIWIYGPDNIVVGNNIGVGADGVTPVPSSGGLNLRELGATRNIIGINVTGYGNIVSNNRERGLTSMGSAYGNLIEGNYIGTDITGTKAMGNFDSGLTFELCGYGSIVRNNVVCANGRYGILVYDDGSSFNVIIGNSLGIGADGKTLLPNQYEPVFTGGGGGACFYNVFGDSDSKLQNITYNTQGGNPLTIPDVGMYETIVNGRVYKSTDKGAY